MKKLIRKILDFIEWHSPFTVATINALERHFNLTTDEVEMLKACIYHKVLKEYVDCPRGERDSSGTPLVLYIVVKVPEARRLINMRRKNVRD